MTHPVMLNIKNVTVSGSHGLKTKFPQRIIVRLAYCTEGWFNGVDYLNLRTS